MFLLPKYINYKLNSKGKYKIHSPYVFDFVSKCLELKPDAGDTARLELFRSNLKNDHRTLRVEDFGAGSKKLGEQRKVSRIYRVSASKGVYARLLYQLNRHYGCKQVLELGTSLGVGTAHLALGNPVSQVMSVDASAETQQIAQENTQKSGISNIRFVHADFNTYLDSLQQERFDLVFIDGHHDGQALLSYLEKLQAFSHEETIFVLDDIRWSENMLNAWEKICADPGYHLTMDLFRMGIAIRRPQQAKEHFAIRLKGVLRGMI